MQRLIRGWCPARPGTWSLLAMAAKCGQVLTSVLPALLLGLTAGRPFISLTGPSRRTTPGNPVPFNCTAGPFSSWDFNVTWMKGSDEHPASAQHLVTNNQGNYFVTSKVWVTLTLQDLLLEITCEVTHRALGEPLRKTMNLSQVLQVVPTLKITTKTSGTYIHVQQRVNLTCHASHFYPSHLRLTWMENRHQVHTVESPQVTRNPDGTYSLKHTWQAEATLDGSEFACWVVQDEQPPVRANITLRAQAPRLGKGGCGLLLAPLGGMAGRVRHENTKHGPGVQAVVGQGLGVALDEGDGREGSLGW
ncbi:tyrosine-protein phosphatase non-receptor type substrate 1-like [Prionailurus bengalensis]|uniref:tyrosine-protein phosphatase non-receptor type substrate 1-like n=1 Tax=Prionailurus bengalensis TaxID=37029 RepID=UPI001CA97D74|nr:tyrosine-protein phosphatase non-receptor type substrate 1-like [Prionailurus bengalensis]